MINTLLFLSCISIIIHSSYNELVPDVWVVIVSSSRYWFNYRHSANGISIYKAMRLLGIPDTNIIFMNALDISMNSRNINRGYVQFNSNNDIHNVIWSMDEVEVDYTQEETNLQNLKQLLAGRDSSNIMKSQLLSHSNSSIFIYFTGHGGNEFFKFHDHEELSAQDLGLIFDEMYIKHRYKEIIFIIDTCKASTMANYIKAPGIITLASSKENENSYGYGVNDNIGVASADRFTYAVYDFFIKKVINNINNNKFTLNDLYLSFNYHRIHSTPVIIKSHINKTRDSKDTNLIEFFKIKDYMKIDILKPFKDFNYKENEDEFLIFKQFIDQELLSD